MKGRRGALAGAALIVVVLTFALARGLPVRVTPDYPLASKGPPAGWNVQAAFVPCTLAELLARAHSVVWVDVLEVEERWTWQGCEWSRYKAAVRQYIVNRTGSTPATLSIVQPGGGKEIYYNYHHLQPGRGYILVLTSDECGGRFCPNILAHPVGLFPLVATDVVETWWPPPWASEKSPYMGVNELIDRIRKLAGG